MNLSFQLVLAIVFAVSAAAFLAVTLATQLHGLAVSRVGQRTETASASGRNRHQIQASLAFALLGALLARNGGVFAIVAAGIFCGLAGWFLPPFLAHVRRGKAYQIRERQIPSALDLLANGMRAGMSFLQAWTFATRQTAEPLGSEMSVTLNEIQLGRPLEDALERLRQRVRCEDMDLTVSAIRLTLQTGGDLPKGLATIAGTIRARAIMRAKIDSLTAQGRLQALLVAAIPVVMIFVTYAIDPARTSLLWTTAYGWILLAVLAVMDILGFLTIQWICRIKI